MTFDDLLKFAKDFEVVPQVCNITQLLDVFHGVNTGGGDADDSVDLLDRRGFMQLIKRLGFFIQLPRATLRMEKFFDILESTRLQASVAVSARGMNVLRVGRFKYRPVL